MENLYLIVGLGNPGRDYARTRHNAGFMVLDQLAEGWKASWSVEKKFASRVAKAERHGKKLILAQPDTFMNASGKAAGALVNFHKVPVSQVLVVVDDADLSLGEIRLRPGGSSGGHHGLESIEQHLGTTEYARQRIGIGRNDAVDRQITSHVLSDFRTDEQKILEKVLQKACKQIECWLASGVMQAMNQFNGVTKV
jgi:peptidyl-tRNA hydrolase, PTH1 family